MKKKVTVVLVPTGDEVTLFRRPVVGGTELFGADGLDPQTGRSINSSCEGLYMYICDPEAEIKGQEWYYSPVTKTVHQANRLKIAINHPDYLKVISSTDPKLQAEGIPSISEQFIKEYVQNNGECEVEMEIEEPFCLCGMSDYYHCDGGGSRCSEALRTPAKDSEGNLVLSVVKTEKKVPVYDLTNGNLLGWDRVGDTEKMHKMYDEIGKDLRGDIQQSEEAIQKQIEEAAEKYADTFYDRKSLALIPDTPSEQKAWKDTVSDWRNAVEWARKNLL